MPQRQAVLADTYRGGNMSFKKSLGKSFVLLIIILILLAGGLLWFDYLGVVHVKSVFSPAYKILKKDPQTSSTSTQSRPLVANLDEDRLRKQREALDIFKEELDKRETDIQAAEKQNEQVSAELAERSARYSAAILTACAIKTGEGKNAAKPICILCDGTTFFKTYKVRERVYGYLDEVLTRQLGIYWNIVSCDNDITLGAAISGLID